MEELRGADNATLQDITTEQVIKIYTTTTDANDPLRKFIIGVLGDNKPVVDFMSDPRE